MIKKPRLGLVGFGAQGATYARLISDGRVPASRSARFATEIQPGGRLPSRRTPGFRFMTTTWRCWKAALSMQ
jgi:hypothetical protein